ncbi:MAG: enoyl-CoA hydratase-related protein [Vicinamibacterales bacterium]
MAKRYEFLQVTRDGPVERVALDRPEVRNAFNEGMIRELRDWAERAAGDGGLRVAILEGRGRAFSAGADLAWMARVASYTREENLRDASALAAMFASLDRLPKPLVGRVHGAALGGGSGLVAVCDIVVADEEAVFGFTEVRLGLTPAVIAPYVIRKTGQSAARELFLRGARFGAARAREIGLVHEVAASGTLDARIDVVVADLLAGGPEALAVTKQLVAEATGRPPGDVLPATIAAIAERRASEEGRSGIRAFLEKGQPPWAQG